jgi:hypothetical protein
MLENEPIQHYAEQMLTILYCTEIKNAGFADDVCNDSFVKRSSLVLIYFVTTSIRKYQF